MHSTHNVRRRHGAAPAGKARDRVRARKVRSATSRADTLDAACAERGARHRGRLSGALVIATKVRQEMSDPEAGLHKRSRLSRHWGRTPPSQSCPTTAYERP